ncbi:PI-PLC X domain-containing protein At5g67130-like isoform X2 [Camellia sinensis]|uniref:PI-PLC X domain-containing protein At5g67130-like isoform X2 n=1 Tax=Camellia sinensis TaxID=4442 RepID=UPI001036B589|nr:PI-PLC X domain-containing protein At5g67130-like isoform X2 [Camellia sinensis]
MKACNLQTIKFMLNPSITTLFVLTFLSGFSSSFKEGQTCVADRNCNAGLHCEMCLASGMKRPRCTRIRPVIPTSKVKGLPFNRYSWLTTHNAFARLGERSDTGSLILSPTNQQDSITDQLHVTLSLSLFPTQLPVCLALTIFFVLVLVFFSRMRERAVVRWWRLWNYYYYYYFNIL